MLATRGGQYHHDYYQLPCIIPAGLFMGYAARYLLGSRFLSDMWDPLSLRVPSCYRRDLCMGCR